MQNIRHLSRLVALAALALALTSCGDLAKLTINDGTGPTPVLPPPNPTLVPTINVAKAVGWKGDARPTSADDTTVNVFADGLDHPRWLYVLPNGDVLVAESNKPKREGFAGIKAWVTSLFMGRAGAGVVSADRITLLRDADHDGYAETRSVFLEGLKSPFGMVLIGHAFYVANADALIRFPYRDGQMSIDADGVKMADLPAGRNHHWTKNVIASKDGTKLYISVGSNSNVAENGIEEEAGRAAIWEFDRSTRVMRQYAGGLRNPNGMDWEPVTGALWAAVNERDEIGSDLVPDYVTSVREGGFYGWPYSYFGQHVDTRARPPRPDLVASALVPDYALGAHTASLGIAFSRGNAPSERWRDGLFVAQHGSWNRNPKSGYKVIFVPFDKGRPAGKPVDVLTNFLDENDYAQGRPVDVIQDTQGALLVSDDVGNRIWRVSARR